MRVTRSLVLLVVAAGLVAPDAAFAVARPRPVCLLVTDPRGDASAQPPLPSDDALDVVSADVASDARYVTAAIRVKNIAAPSPSAAGRVLRLAMRVPGAVAPVYLSYSSSAYGGDVYEYGLLGRGPGGSTSPTGTARGVVDTRRNEVRISVPVSQLKALGSVRPGSVFSHLDVTAEQLLGVAPNRAEVYAFEGFVADEATSRKVYVAGAPSCVRPGA